MTTLNDIIIQQSTPYFPERSKACLSMFRVWDRKEVRGVEIPDCVTLNWAEFTPGKGWLGAVGYYRDDLEEKDFHLLDNDVFEEWL